MKRIFFISLMLLLSNVLYIHSQLQPSLEDLHGIDNDMGDVSVTFPTDQFDCIKTYNQIGFEDMIKIPLLFKGGPEYFGPHLIFESKDKDCVLLYTSIQSCDQALKENADCQLKAYEGDLEKDVSALMTDIKQTKIIDRTNADEVWMFEVTLPESYMGKYQHSVNIFMEKYAHPAVELKLILSEEGLKNKEKYIQTAIDSIRYGNSITEKGEKDAKQAKWWREEYYPEYISKGLKAIGYSLPE